MRIETLGLNFMDTEKVIASFLLVGEREAALVESGPTTCLPNLMEGLRSRGVSPEDVGRVFLTHVHLDHAGAAGNLAEVLPNATFYVHEVGHSHLIDPTKLLKSAAMIYGDRMEEMWGEVRPVPEERLSSLSGSEEMEAVDGTTLRAFHTPGHAYHHLAFFEPSSGALFTGDVAGVRIQGESYVRPPTPPPELDVEAWTSSLELIRGISPRSLLPTHFGRFEDVGRHLNELEHRLEKWASIAEKHDDGEELAAELEEVGEGELSEAGALSGDSERYRLAAEYRMLADGLLRYVEKFRRSGGR
jgi:glyoxylase-like metal-dependent hydrolase (beta-lactamase superfamily II)